MNDYSVEIPGCIRPYEAIADTPEAALRDALRFHGLPQPPPGTTVTWRVKEWR